MVFVAQSERSEIYSTIQKKAAASVCSVLIFVAPSVDSLCALKILVVRAKGSSSHDFTIL